MLTAETKRKIDYLRDVLVGKIPVPSQQIEQITLGLIYKFMSDIDEQNEELGGKSFFRGEYKKYAWRNIMDRSLAGHERVLFYSEGLEKMGRNKELPQLFRDIFKGAFLPFKDPAVLDLFLKGINEFKYEHSEELGNAFEYLLSTAASQGDAGQFRTPRHIIDFIVEAVDPQKEDRILDPACGTAGFLVSAYKHILKNNTDKKSDKLGSLLTSTERKKLTKNIVGYDISHEMVRLSLVNLYLHGFAEPNIYEYDTLSSLDRWDDNFDCLLANPPFMTPRGGIRPHNRFPIQANRSEVLFVDYIIEHLTPNGKAGIIVPEGIIFQSGNAYKQLRKMLVEDGLWAVVSLPHGVFNPYASVKTSILFFNNTIARQTKEVLFVKVENDGRDLGAQRRPIDKNDLPTRLELLTKYKKAIQEGKKFNLSKEELKFASVVKKEKIAENGDYNLSADRYFAATDYSNAEWPLVGLSDVCEIFGGDSAPQGEEHFSDNGTPFVRMKDLGRYHITDNLSEVDDHLTEITIKAKKISIWPKGSILLPRSGSVYLNHRAILGVDAAVVGHIAILANFSEKIINKFLFYILLSFNFSKIANKTSGLDQMSLSSLKKIKIPLPPIEVQKEIIAELENYQKIIDGAKQIIDSYKPTIKIDPKWEIAELGKICDVRDGTHDSPKYKLEGYPLITSKNIVGDKIDFSDVNLVSKDDFEKINKRSRVDDGDIIMPMIGTIGNPIVVKKDRDFAIKNVALIKFYKNSKIERYFLKHVLKSDNFNKYFKNNSEGSTQKFISLGFIRNIKIPLPSIEIQRNIVSQIEDEQKYVCSAKEMIKLFEHKIKDKISDLWGE